MKQRRTNTEPLTRVGQGLFVMLVAVAFCLLAVSSPVQAQRGPFDRPAITAYWGGTVTGDDGTQLEFLGNRFFANAIFYLDPKDIDGTGFYRILDSDGHELYSGTWTLTRLRRFKPTAYCNSTPACPLPDHWYAGTMWADIALEGLGEGRLTVWCSLPGVPTAGGLETFRLRVNGFDFNGREPNLTLFTQQFPGLP